jgi:hypothetical protein
MDTAGTIFSAFSLNYIIGCTRGPINLRWSFQKGNQSTSKGFPGIFQTLNFRLIAYCVSKLQMLIGAGVKPIIVLDGCKLEMKLGIEEERAR